MTASIIGSRSVGISSNDLKKLQRFLVAKAKNPLGGQADEMSAVLNAAVENKTTPFTRAQVEKGSNLFEQLSQQFGVDPDETSLTEDEKEKLKSAQDTLRERKESYENAKKNYYTFLTKVELEGNKATKFKGSWVEKLKARYKRWRFNRGRAEKFTEFVESHTQTQDNNSSLSVEFIKNNCKNLLAEMVKDENFTLEAWNREMKSFKTIQDFYSRRGNENAPEMIGLKAIINVISNSLVNKNHYLNALNTLQNTTVVLENDAEKGKELFTKAKEQIDKFEWKEGNIGFFSKEKMIEKLNEKVAEIETQYPELKAPTKDDSLDKIKQDASNIKKQLGLEMSYDLKFNSYDLKSVLDGLMQKFKKLAGDDQSKYTPEQTEVFNLLSDIENSLHNKEMYSNNKSKIRTAFEKYNLDKDAGYDEIKKLAPMLEASAAKYLNASDYSADWCNKMLADFFEKEVAKYPELKQKLDDEIPLLATPGSKPEDVSDLQYKTLYERLKQESAEEIERLKQELDASKEINETLNAQLAQQTANAKLNDQKKLLDQRSEKAYYDSAKRLRKIGSEITDLDWEINRLKNGAAYRQEVLNSEKPEIQQYLQNINMLPNREELFSEFCDRYANKENREIISELENKLNKLLKQKNDLEAYQQAFKSKQGVMDDLSKQYESITQKFNDYMRLYDDNLGFYDNQMQTQDARQQQHYIDEAKRLEELIFQEKETGRKR